MLPVITVIGIEAAFLIGGLIVTETVFNIPRRRALSGRGDPLARLSDRAEPGDVHRRGRGAINFMVDLLYAVLDPRIRYTELTGRAILPWRIELRYRAATRGRLFHPWLAWLVFLARRHRSARPACHHDGVRAGRVSSPMSSAATIRWTVECRACAGAPSARIGWERIPSAATSIAGSSMARASRLRSASARPRSARYSASCSAWPRAISAAGSIWCSSASSTSCRRCRCWCWLWS
jgi:hypothetical protein